MEEVGLNLKQMKYFFIQLFDLNNNTKHHFIMGYCYETKAWNATIKKMERWMASKAKIKK